MKQYTYDGKEYTVQGKQYEYKGNTYPALYITSNDGEEFVVDGMTEEDIISRHHFEYIIESVYCDTSEEFLQLVKKGA